VPIVKGEVVSKKPKKPVEPNPYVLLTPPLIERIKIGWQEFPGLPQTRMNRKGWGILWLAVLRGKSGYDRPQFLEGPCVVVVIRGRGGRIAFVKTARTHRPRLVEALFPPNGEGYIGRLVDGKLFEKLIAGPVSESIELPAGIVDSGDFDVDKGVEHIAQRYRAAIKRAAKREAEEETGLKVKIVRTFVDFTNPNPAWFLHPHSVAIAELVSAGKQQLEEMEGAKKLVWYRPKEIRRLIKRGEIFDSRVIHALTLAGVRLN
jgi:8-oxo-dGTP pyrophosphatase MutT (NUDIX family)